MTKTCFRAVQQVGQIRRSDPNYRVTMRLIPAFYDTHTLPGSLSIDEALEQAHALAKGGCRFALNTPDNMTYWCKEDGDIEAISDGQEPYMSVGGQSFRLTVGDDSKPEVVFIRTPEKN